MGAVQTSGGETVTRTQARWLWLSLCTLALAAVRLSLLTFDTDLSAAFSHDSAYVAIVARNLINGLGWVNDASWLVFLHPASLPMPYRNANPLYPLFTALAAKTFGMGVVRAGLLVAAMADVALLPASFLLVSHWIKSTRTALWISVAVALFPSLWWDSLRMLPDSLYVALLIGGIACLVRAENRWWAACAGILLAAAWLTRSTATLVAPAIVLYALAIWGWRKALPRLALMAVVALAVALPWLMQSARIWGSPFGSDGSYAAFQDLYARSYSGSIERYWHSPIPPPSPGELMRTDGMAVVAHTVTGIPNVFRSWLRAGWEDQYLPRLVFLLMLTGMALTWRRRLWTAPLVASTVYGALQIGAFGVRGGSVEARYLAPLTVLAVLWSGSGVAALLAKDTLQKLARYTLLAGVAFWIVYVPIQDAHLARQGASQDPAFSERRRVRREISRSITHHDPTIVVDPYFYSYDTGAQALSIPYSSDSYLMSYMEQYHCRWIILSDDEIRFWKPDWPAHLPPWLRIRGAWAGNTLFERMPY